MDTDQTREERIAAAEARQETEYAEGGTIEERLDELDALKAEILADETVEE